MGSTTVKQLYDQAVRSFQNKNYAGALLLLTCAEAMPEWDKVGLRSRGSLVYVRARCLYSLGWLDNALACCTLLKKTYQDPRGAALAKRILGTGHDNEQAA